MSLSRFRLGKVHSEAGASEGYSLVRVKISVSGSQPFSLDELWLSVPRQLCLKYPIFSLTTLPDFALCWLWPLPTVHMMLYLLINLLGKQHNLYKTSQSQLSYSLPSFLLAISQWDPITEEWAAGWD